jgi:predicted TIM-barrel fold metal-dependent hydrolase
VHENDVSWEANTNKKSERHRDVKAAIDVHVHLAALPDGDNGCYMSRKMMRSLSFRYLVWRQGLDPSCPTTANSTYVAGLLSELQRSEKVGQVVLLGLDGVYDNKGRLDLAQTDFLISNDYVLQVAGREPELFLPGVSINPRRRDALDELDRCAEAGAVLVKVLPNAQGFDPGDPRYLPFFKALAHHRIPLLSHVGYEFSLMGKDQSAGDPAKLRPVLDQGVCVVAAHACTYGLGFLEPYFTTFRQLAREYDCFYADTSALTLPNRARMLFLLRRYPELHERLVFGTDYPLPVFSYPSLLMGSFDALRCRNPFDRQALVLESLGIQFRDFSYLRRMRQ